ncbi:single-stranded-DNA-specific exonuclease RecJ [Candidatus Peregrinibacteria bacterium]|nr:single-stranded-DNA-specific exonuclease RecJ [Candidatus Peregrinibacteria bacterium]
MSILGKKWIIKNTNKNKKILEKILENRGLLNKKPLQTFHDPFLFRDMEKAVNRIKKAIEKEERIIVFGDYDVDGITGTAILVHILKKLNARVSYRLPNRIDDGYGLSEKFIKDFEEKNVKLLITVDCGISCADIIEKIKKKGIETILTDHHTIPENKPEKAIAVLHPKEKNSNYPFKDLTGAGVALKLAHALIEKLLPAEVGESNFESLIDLAALGTVADLGPLKDENWLIVKKGIKKLSDTKWIGLKKIMTLSAVKKGYDIDTSTIGYRIAPRINAAGRIGDPYLALSLLLQEDQNERVDLLGNKLEQLNSLRKEITLSALMEAEQNIVKIKDMPFILIAENSEWHVGILGLIAGKLVEKYARPAIIMQDFGDILVASARSPEYFNVIEAISSLKEYLITFGGHAQAAGFNIKKENLKIFKKEISAFAEKKLKNKELMPSLEIDCEINKSEIGFNLVDELSIIKPFGVKNSKPTFLLQGIEPYFISQVGKEKNHLKFSIKLKEKDIQVIAFRMGRFADDLRKHKKIDIVFHLDRNRWNNREYLQFHALDYRKSAK